MENLGIFNFRVENNNGRMEQLDSESHDSTVLLSSLLNSVPFGIMVLNSQGNIKLLNQNAEEQLTFGLPIDEINGTSILSYVGQLQPFVQELENFLTHPETFKIFESVL